MRQRNPGHVRSLRYFEAVARHGSMLGASSELGVSPSAVSHQLRDLTRSVGEKLFERSGRGIVLTAAGRSLAGRLSSTFEALDSTIVDLVGREDDVLRIAVCSSFGPSWLVPRLADFRNCHPDLPLEIRLYAENPEMSQAVADCIVTARGKAPGFASADLFDEMLTAVVSPAGAGAALPLITTDSAPGKEEKDWRDYARQTGLDIHEISRGGWLRCTHYILAMAMATEGLGVALVPTFVAERALREGRVDVRYPDLRPSGRTYRVCYKEARARQPRLRKLVTWMQREAALVRAAE